MQKMSLLLIGLVGFGHSVVQASCNYGQNLDLRIVHEKIFNNLPIQDQGSVGVCYAYAAATLIDFHRMRLNSDRAALMWTDPTSAAQAGTLEAQDGDIEGGEICDVVNGMVKRGVGYTSVSLSTGQTLDLGIQTQAQAVNQVFLTYLSDGNKSFKPVDIKSFPLTKRTSLKADEQAYLKKFDGLIAWIKTEIGRRGIDPKGIPSDAEIFDFIQSNHIHNDYANFPVKFEMFISGDAKNRAGFKMPHLECRNEKGLSDGSSYLGTLDRTLDYQQLPVGIDLCANVLSQKDYRGYEVGSQRPGKLKSSCKPHAVLVIGKRWGRQGCEYLLRNSWGNHRYPWPTDNGDVWVSENALAPNLFGTSIVL